MTDVINVEVCADDDLDVLRPHSQLLQLSEDAGRLFGRGIRAIRIRGHSRADLPPPSAAGEEWLPVLRQWLARQNCGLVSIANPGGFSWPGHWIGIVDRADTQSEQVGVLLFGTPSAVIASPDAPHLVGRGVEELAFQQALVLVPFDPFTQVAVDRVRTVGE